MAAPLEYDPEQPDMSAHTRPAVHHVASAPYPPVPVVFPRQQSWQEPTIVGPTFPAAQHGSQLRPQQQYATANTPYAPPPPYPIMAPPPSTFSALQQPYSTSHLADSAFTTAPPPHASGIQEEPILPEQQRHYVNAIFTPGVSNSAHRAADDRAVYAQFGETKHLPPDPSCISPTMDIDDDSQQRQHASSPQYQHRLAESPTKPAATLAAHEHSRPSTGLLPTPQIHGPTPATDPRRPRSESAKPKHISLQDELDMLFVTPDKGHKEAKS